tara:strand:+ start:1847 stop:2017 length:171 start_codon:yes stop_codon:yes gene_type:complete
MKKYKQGDLDETAVKLERPANNMPKVEEGGKNEDAPKVKTNMVDKSVFSKADERDY